MTDLNKPKDSVMGQQLYKELRSLSSECDDEMENQMQIPYFCLLKKVFQNVYSEVIQERLYKEKASSQKTNLKDCI